MLNLPDLKLLYVGGEALPPDVVNRWAKGRRLVNGYGPTECTVTALRSDIVEGESITVGQPIPGVQAWVLDTQYNEVPTGEKGELCLGGQCLARGYLNQPKMSEDKFIFHPRLGRIYRTGDWVHCSTDGSFFFLRKISIHDDFFNDLGGDSLHAALLISLFREDADTCFITVRDLYEARSVSKLAQMVQPVEDSQTTVSESDQQEKSASHPLTATLLQTLWLALGLIISGPIVYFLFFQVLPAIAHRLGILPLLLLSPILLLPVLAVYTMVSVGLAVLMKKLFIGTYQPIKAPAWGHFYVRKMLLGRVRPGTHPLWSCWCSRWDFLYVAWGVCARGPLTPLQGTLLISWYLRAMGAKIGRHVLLNNLFAQVVDPDMLTFEDGATVNCLFQAHTFEDRVLKINRICLHRQATAGNNAVLLYGADLGEKTYVAPYSVVMKHERLLPYRAYIGVPIR